jgi:sensor histidine kinase YesM
LFWSTWVFSFTLIQGMGTKMHPYFVWFMYYLITLPIFIAHTYIIAYWVLPQTFFKERYFLSVLALIVLLIVFSVIELIVSNELVFKLFAHEKVFEPGYLNIKNIVISGIGNHYIIFAFLAIKVGRSWYQAKNRKDKLLQLNVETELEIYRYQLQPQLIYTLMDELEKIAKSEGEKAPEMIIKISAFLNRFLYESKEELIPLQLEVQLLQEFLEIHKVAKSKQLTSNLISNGNLKSYVVPPMLLLPFINNSFKIMYECNETFESNVIIKAEKKYLLFSFTFWSEKEYRIQSNQNSEITSKRLNNKFPGKYRLIENIDENFREISIEIFK